MSIALCPHLSLEHYRGGEKWTAALANRFAADGIDVSVRALPYTPHGRRRIAASEILDSSISYQERWHHDLSEFDIAYIFYHPFCRRFFTGETRSIAGIHSWVYISDQIYERHYDIVPTTVKALYRAVGTRELNRFDAVHTVTEAFDSPHSNTHYIPNFVDTESFHPRRVAKANEFTVLVTAAHLRAKGWNVTQQVARTLKGEAVVNATGNSDNNYITELGFLDEDALADAYSNAHVVLHPAQIDADSLVIKEAMASGTPVVTTPLPTHPLEGEAVLHGTTVGDFVARIRTLRWEWMHGERYDRRCRIARAEGAKSAFDGVYPKLKKLLLFDETSHNKRCFIS